MDTAADTATTVATRPAAGLTIDVIMTCYNEGAYITAAIDSIVSQTRYDLIERIVVVDDGSRPDTTDVLKGLEARVPRLKVIYSGGNGLPKARNLAADHCTSDWIAILDGDDIWTDDKIEQQIAAIASAPKAGLVYTGYLQFDNENPDNRIVAHVNDLGGSPDLLREYFLKEGPIIPSTILVRRDLFEQVGRFDARIKVFEDTEFYGRMADVCEFCCVDRPLLQKRVHANSITAKRQEMMAHHAFVAFHLAARFPRLYPLVPRRLSERARKLGNTAVELGSDAEAGRFYRLAVQLSPLSWRAQLSFWAHRLGLPLGAMKKRAAARREGQVAHGQ